MYTYSAYGLIIQSSLQLPELQPSKDTKVDVEIRIETINNFPPQTTTTGSYFYTTANEAYLFWDVVGKFLVRDGKEIIIDPIPGVDEQLMRLPLLGSVLAMLLHQREFLILHASAVAIQGEVVAFLGASGRGKSTMAATLCAQGHHMIADDVVAVSLSHTGNPVVFPSFPQIKLWPEAAAAIGKDPQLLPRLHSQVEKRICRVADIAQGSLPLKRIYVLAGGSDLAINPLSPQAAVLELISNSYIGVLSKHLLQGNAASRHLSQCTSLLKDIPIKRLERPRSLSLLPAIAQLVAEDLASPVHNLVSHAQKVYSQR